LTVYTVRPRRAEAVQWDGENTDEIKALAGDQFVHEEPGGHLLVWGSGGTCRDFSIGDWVIRDLADGWVHPASPETFIRVWQAELKLFTWLSVHGSLVPRKGREKTH
jgi:hypothetical protein